MVHTQPLGATQLSAHTHIRTYICTQYLVTQGKMSVLTICLQCVCVETRRLVIVPAHELESAKGYHLNLQM